MNKRLLNKLVCKSKIKCYVAVLLSIAFSFGTSTVALSASIGNAVENINGAITIKADCEISSSSKTFLFDCPESGEFYIAFNGIQSDLAYNDIEMKITIDSKSISDNESINVSRLWTDDGDIRVDGKGNEFAAKQKSFDDVSVIYPTVNGNVISTQLNEGEHNITLVATEGKYNLESMVLFPVDSISKYSKPNKSEYYNGDTVIIEGEDALYKNSRWLISQSDGDSALVHPYDPYVNKINYIGGTNWKKIGEEITWSVDAPSDGYYQLSFDYRQNGVVNYNCYRTLKIDGVVPFSEASSIAFPYGVNWNNTVFSDEDGNPFLIYLSKGNHTLSLTVTVGEYEKIIKRLNNVVSGIGNIYFEMTMITGETVDLSRDYDLFELIDNLEQNLKNISRELISIKKAMLKISGRNGGSYESVVSNMNRVVNEMLNHKYSAARYKSNFYSSYTSLSQCINDMQDLPLDIDRIIISAPNKEIEKDNVSFFEKSVYSIKKFISSFVNDYESVSEINSEKALTLWVGLGRDQSRVLNDMIASDFTKNTGIDVNVKMVNASIVQAIISGKGPDMIIQQARTEPVNLAMRGALYDLTNFEDYKDVLKSFMPGAETPYYYKNGLYALPDSQVFSMMFYREDILKKFDLTAPKTWDELIEVIKVLSRNNLSVGIPYTQILDNGQASAGVGALSLLPTLMQQRNIPLYSDDLISTTLTSPKVLDTFDFYTSLYTKLKLNVSISFYNRFRDGTCPIGLSSYTLAVTLMTEAPELDGVWKMSVVPGTKDENGNINYSSAGGGTGCSILNMSNHKEEAWEFLKWWTGAEAQMNYSMNVEAILGPLARASVSNVEAFKMMPWTSEQKSSILNAWKYVQEYPEVPGSYQVARSIDMAFYSVSNSNKSSKDMLVKWGQEADKEVLRMTKKYENR